MTLHESVRFALNASNDVASREWTLLSTLPDGFGRVRLGPDFRLLIVTHYHAMHCLRDMETSLVHSAEHADAYAHNIHCFNYLRQLILCEANGSLEEGNFMAKNLEKDRVGGELVCWDWEKVYTALDQNFANWKEWKDKWD